MNSSFHPGEKHIFIIALLLFSLLTGIIFSEVCYAEACSAVPGDTNTGVLIIDPGHGGADGGAVAADGTNESTINLDIALRLDALARFFGQHTILTRDSNDLPYPESEDSIAKKKRWDQHRRLELINSNESAVLISIHQNKYPDPRPYGPQVLYSHSSDSEKLGVKCHELLNTCLSPENRRLAIPASDDIYLMKNAKCTAILVECGFLSNPHELCKLQDNTYQKKLAAILLSAYLCSES